MIFNKLVRDFIPKVIAQKYNKKAITRVLDDAEYRVELERKLTEEVNEYLASDGDMMEIADIFEVLYAIIENRGYKLEEILKLKSEKAKERGGFSKKLFLIEAVDN